MLRQNKLININKFFKLKLHIRKNKEKWNPLIKNYVFGFRHGVYFFNLNKTLLLLKKLIYLFKKITQYLQAFLFIGTNYTVYYIVLIVAKILKQPSITKKWVVSTLTNWLKIKPYFDFLLTKILISLFRGKSYKFSINIPNGFILSSIDLDLFLIYLNQLYIFIIHYNLIYVFSVFAYIYFFFSCYKKFISLKNLYKTISGGFLDKITFNLNYILYKTHLIVLIKQNRYIKFIIIFFIIFKIKILIKLIFFKYVGSIYCFFFLYFQFIFIKHIIFSYFSLLYELKNGFNYNNLLLRMTTLYLRYKNTSIFIILITFIDFIVLFFDFIYNKIN